MMSFDPEEMKFGAVVHQVAEKELQVSLTDDREGRFAKHLWELYRRAGRPRSARAWIRTQLKQSFRCVAEAPKWVEPRPTWPFRDGAPMTFIRQMEVPEFSLDDGKTSVACVLYVFCCAIACPEHGSGAWEMVYQVVSQHPTLLEDFGAVKLIDGPDTF